MATITQEYRSWILEQQLSECTIAQSSKDRITLTSAVATGEINFYDINDSVVVELRLERTKDGESAFFLHFELEDIERAKALFSDMAKTYEEMRNRTVKHVLLCCTCGITTTFFSNKLNELATTADLDYDFCAKSVDEAKESGNKFVAVLLAPQVGHMRKELVAALPDTIVIELPGAVFGSYDAGAALQMVVEAVTGARKAAKTDLRMARDFDRSKRVLAVSYVQREDESTLSYRVLDKGEVTLAEILVRSKLDRHLLDDLTATLRVAGYPPQSFDAIGIAIPGMVDNGVVVNGIGGDGQRFDLATELSNKWGVTVRVDNNATAAAAGCYVSQTEWDDVVFHAQAIGVSACDEGLVIGGLTRAGKSGFAGNLRYIANNFSLSMDLEDAAWRYDGTRELVARYLEATICAVAPQAAFVWCDLLPDMSELKEELLKTLPTEVIPELVGVPDYDGLTLLGELSLCLQGLS